MAIVDMMHLSLLGMKEDKKKILDMLLRLGAVEISEMEPPTEGIKSELDEAELQKVDTRLQDLENAIELLQKADNKKQSMFTPKPVYNQAQYDEIIMRQEECSQICSSIKVISQRLSQLSTDETTINNKILSLSHWAELDVPVGSIGRFKSIFSMIGTIPALADEVKLKEELKERVSEVYMEEISRDKELIYVFMVYSVEKEEQLLEVLRMYSYNRISFNDLEATTGQEIQALKLQISKLEKEREELKEKLAEYIPHRELIKVNFDHFSAEKEKLLVEAKLLGTGNVFALAGWIPASQADELRKDAALVSEYIHMDIYDPLPDEEFPVLIKNPRAVWSMEIITELYSAPSCRGIDPTLVMAPFFWFLFGMMVSDAAYGVILSIITFIMIKKMKPEGTMKKILELLFIGGFFVLFWGTLFGSWFGGINDIFQNETLGRLTKPIWFNPLDDPMRLLVWSFIFGSVHLMAGLCMEIYKQVRRGNILDAIMDQVSWIVLLLGIGLQFLPALAGPGQIMIGIGVVTLLLTQGRSEKNILLKIVKGVLSLYNITAYLSDVLSYSRLLALGLATGVIATVVNTMGLLAGGGVVGTLVLIAVFIVGHGFNLAINVLGAYVHSSRLQYVEFFGKFFESGGRTFRPLKRKNKYFTLNSI